MITERQKLVLIGIVEGYVKTNEPVGSLVLSKRPELNFSTATLRNDMAELEELGYLEKMHTSSGRVPSEKGYRLYVEEICVSILEIITKCFYLIVHYLILGRLAAAIDWPTRREFSSGIISLILAKWGNSFLKTSLALSTTIRPPSPLVTRPNNNKYLIS